MPIVLSHYQTRILEKAKANAQTEVTISPDLGLSDVLVTLTDEGGYFPDGELLSWAQVAEISANENNCFVLVEGEFEKILVFSELTNRSYSLMPTEGAPTMLISGIPMHRIKGVDPHRDTLNKVKTVQPIQGHVLDTATGLGYTAIETARTAVQVDTIELDPAALEIARHNPWSRGLFDNPKIKQHVGDSFDLILDIGDETFDCIIHDPPAFSLAGDLYSREFYGDLYRVLKPGGKLFHYIGNPESKSGANVTRGALNRLGEVGFTNLRRQPRAFGILARKK
ncbi:MAG: methyltransferase domain-containing protein [Anaerolineales bacterium]|nr:methyltransferase domain-containing protein [Anaerolineales bacterium]